VTEYIIKDIKKTNPEEGKNYFFDTNVWYFILKPPTELKPSEQHYVNFFDGLINLASNERCKNKPQIVICGELLSELINMYMRASLDIFKKFNPQHKKINLKEFRGFDEYDMSVDIFRQDFFAFEDYLSFPGKSYSPLKALSDYPANMDFNDYYYYELALENDLSIITHDRDFCLAGVEIITNNAQLLKL